MKPGLVPEVQNRPVCFLLFGRGDPDLQIGLEMLHKIVTVITGDHIQHGLTDGLIVHLLVSSFYVMAFDKCFQCIQFFRLCLKRRFFTFIDIFQEFFFFPFQNSFDIGDADPQFPVDGDFLQALYIFFCIVAVSVGLLGRLYKSLFLIKFDRAAGQIHLPDDFVDQHVWCLLF